jgi:hypothetical protein
MNAVLDHIRIENTKQNRDKEKHYINTFQEVLCLLRLTASLTVLASAHNRLVRGFWIVK